MPSQFALVIKNNCVLRPPINVKAWTYMNLLQIRAKVDQLDSPLWAIVRWIQRERERESWKNSSIHQPFRSKEDVIFHVNLGWMRFWSGRRILCKSLVPLRRWLMSLSPLTTKSWVTFAIARHTMLTQSLSARWFCRKLGASDRIVNHD